MKIIYYGLLIVLVSAALLAFRRAKLGANITAIDVWFLSMDVTAHGQRYQGERSTVMFTFFTEKTGIATVTTKRLCKTKSGRYFEIEMVSEFCEVNHWSITPITNEDGDAFLSQVGASAGSQGTTSPALPPPTPNA